MGRNIDCSDSTLGLRVLVSCVHSSALQLRMVKVFVITQEGGSIVGLVSYLYTNKPFQSVTGKVTSTALRYINGCRICFDIMTGKNGVNLAC